MVDFSTFLAPPGDLTDKYDELEVEGFATNKIKSLPLKIKKARKSSESQCFEGEPQKKTERKCSVNEETRSSGSVAGKVFTGNLFLNCIFKSFRWILVFLLYIFKGVHRLLVRRFKLLSSPPRLCHQPPLPGDQPTQREQD